MITRTSTLAIIACIASGMLFSTPDVAFAARTSSTKSASTQKASSTTQKRLATKSSRGQTTKASSKAKRTSTTKTKSVSGAKSTASNRKKTTAKTASKTVSPSNKDSASRQNLAKEQQSLKGEITSVKKAIEQKQKRMNQTVSDLKQSEKAISESNRTLQQLGNRRERVQTRLSSLNKESSFIDSQVKNAEDIVSAISYAQFMNSRRTPLQNVLEGGNPNDVSRLSASLAFMASEQDRTLTRLESRQKHIDAVTEKTTETRAELDRIAKDEEKNRRQLERDKNTRQKAVETLKKEISSQQERYEQLVKNEKELGQLIATLDRQIAEAQRKARERQLAAEKAAKEAAKKRELAQKSQKSSTPSTKVAPPREADTRTVATAPKLGNFGALKGKLTMPTKGTLAARFGQKRAGAASSLSWRGWMIRANAGQKVVATAPGTVVFSDWMRGFGNLLILDHGSNYLSVYANNESLYKNVGEHVRQGEAIASVGNSGGEDAPGLYFELRYRGKPFNPQSWVAR